MNMKLALTALLSLVCATALSAQTTKPKTSPSSQPGRSDKKEPEPPAAPVTRVMDDGKTYQMLGAGVQDGKAQSVTDVIAKAEANDGKAIRIAGTIKSVCQKRGCWVRISDGGDEIFVKTDYTFFLPKDAAGKQVVLEGKFALKEQSVDEQKHYLEDAGKKEEAAKIVAPKREFTMLANGAALQQTPAAKPANDRKGESKDGAPTPAPEAGTKK